MTQLNLSSVHYHGLEIAIIGMAGRFPGADSVAAFWRNLLNGVESIVPLSDEFLRQQGATDAMLNDPQWRKVGAPMAGADQFDADFFGYSPREAELLDPQQRVFLECAWHALEDAGCDPARYPGNIGVFGGAGMNGYLLNLYANPQVRAQTSPFELFVANDKDFLATRVSYKLGLRGPGLDVQTACSTSLVAVHLACQSLIAGESDLALAGGVAVSRQMGYRTQQGGIYSPDGHCRAFDTQAAGTVGGNGVGIVVLKRLQDAQTDGDNIVAVIKGSAINNDGNDKVSFTAPSLNAQAAVVQSAHEVAGVSADSIGYVEAHGTGTHLGDPIEIAALTQAFSANNTNTPKDSVAIGSVKTNIGHLDAAAGIASLIKTALIVKEGQIPASLHFTQPNPQIDFAATPFRVNHQHTSWNAPLRRAGVSSFGIGGTNAHAVLEQPPQPLEQNHSAAPQLLTLAARTPEALQQQAQQLSDYLSQHPEARLENIAWTLQTGRHHFPHRWHTVADNIETAQVALHALSNSSLPTQSNLDKTPDLVWLLPGQGSQYPGMAQDLYAQQPVFRAAIDRCAAVLNDSLEIDLVTLLCDPAQGDMLQQTRFTQPALFVFEYALAQLWLRWGVQPRAMIGHSLGEFVAACLAGVFDLNTALNLVQQRAQWMQDMPTGAMLAIMASTQIVSPWLDSQSTVAAINGAELCVISGPTDAIDRFQARCQANSLTCQRLRTSHGFHSPAMADAAQSFCSALTQCTLHPPRIPFVSNLTGQWITAEQASSPEYWANQMLAPVQFHQGVQTLLSLSTPLFLEVGPGTTLNGLLDHDIACSTESRLRHRVSSLPARQADGSGTAQLLAAVGKIWQWGISPDWNVIHPGTRQRVSLPGYPFQRQRFWVDANADIQRGTLPINDSGITLQNDLANYAYAPCWRQAPLTTHLPKAGRPESWLILLSGDNDIQSALAQALGNQIETAGFNLFTACEGHAFAQTDYRAFQFNPSDTAHYRQLRDELSNREMPADHIIDLRFIAAEAGDDNGPLTRTLELILCWAETPRPVQIGLFTQGACNVTGDEVTDYRLAMLQGMCQVAGQEYPQIGCRQIDLPANTDNRWIKSRASALWTDLQDEQPASLTAWRGRQRWQPQFQSLPLNALPDRLPRNRRDIHAGGCYLILGDLQRGLGEIWARELAQDKSRRLVLASVEPLPENFIEKCRAQGADIQVVLLDETTHSVENVFAQVEGISGVFVSLPTTHDRSAAPLVLVQPAHFDFNQQSRLDLLQAVIETVSTHNPPWCFVQSSMSSVLGGIGLAPYAAANQGVDALVWNAAVAAAESGPRATAWFSVNWDATLHETAAAQSLGQELQAFALAPAEVWEITRRVIARAEPGQIAISRGDLAQRRAQWLRTRGLAQDEVKSAGQSAYPRPPLATPYVAPRNAVENTIVQLWQELLRIDQVGVEDSFFDLGGHSLLAIQVIGRLRQTFPVQLDLRELLEGTPTVANIAEQISQQMPEASQLDRMNALMAELDALSDDEVAALLQQPERAEESNQ